MEDTLKKSPSNLKSVSTSPSSIFGNKTLENKTIKNCNDSI